MMDRVQVLRDDKQERIGQPGTLPDIIARLRSTQFDPEKQFFRFVIDVQKNPIQPGELRELTMFPFEFLLTEKRGMVEIETGTKDGAMGGKSGIYRERRNKSRLSGHTHPNHPKPEDDSDHPSFADVFASGDAKEGTPLLLIHRGGIIHYRAPSFDPTIQQEVTRFKARDVMSR